MMELKSEEAVSISNLKNVSNLCRVCLTESKTMISLNDPAKNKLEPQITSIFSVLNRVTLQEIYVDDRYPCFICPMCLGLLNISYKFKLQFEKSQRLLDDYFDSDNSNSFNCKIEIVLEEPEEEAPVELISKGSKYNLNNIFVVETINDDDKHEFDGFLQNLGKEVSATFVNQNTINKAEFEEIDDEPISLYIMNQPEEEEEEKESLLKKETQSVDEQVPKSPVSKKGNFKNSKESNQLNSYMCEFCGLVFKTRSSHNHHLLTHKDKKHACKFCSKKYYNNSNLQKHITAVHKNERPHLCTVCGKSFNYANAYEYHMRIHKNERKYKCSYCDKTFIMQCGWIRHLRTHTGQRPYKCAYCDRAFRSNGELVCHTMIHTGYRPYHCKYCNKGFTKTHNLKVHLLQHPGPHACYLCKKTFAEIDCLKLHMKTHKLVL